LTNVVAISAGSQHCLALVGNAPPKLQATATGLNLTSTNLSFQLPTQNGRVYRLETVNSPSDTNWSAVSLVPGNGGFQTMSDSNVTNTARFYRVRQW
jgi:hypothetical protein